LATIFYSSSMITQSINTAQSLELAYIIYKGRSTSSAISMRVSPYVIILQFDTAISSDVLVLA